MVRNLTPLVHDEGGEPQAGTGTPDLPAAALAYASGDTLGMACRVFPLAPGTKVPLLSKAAGGAGVHDATANLQQVAEWWTAYPDANIGLATGGGLLGVDVDVKGDHDGAASLAEAIRRHGALPDTAGQVTPSGGFHLLYAVPMGRAIRKARHLGLQGVDLQHTGRYLVAAPSTLEGGGEYRTVRVRAGQFLPVEGDRPRIAPAPWWLLEPVVAEGTTMLRTVAERHAPRYADGAMGTREGLAALDGLCAWLAGQRLGNVNDGLNWAAYCAGGYVASGHLDYHHAETQLRGAAMRAGHHLRHNTPDARAEAGMDATLASGLGDGMTQPAEPVRPDGPAARKALTRVKGLDGIGRTGRPSRVKGLGRG